MNNIADYKWDLHGKPDCFNFYQRHLIQEIIKLKPKKILDIGSGNGYFCNILKKYCDRIDGIEPSLRGYEISKKEYSDLNFYNKSCYDNPEDFKNNYDLVISTEVIEHLYYPSKLIQFARECIKDKGYLIITTPYHGYLKNLAISIINGWDKHFTVDRDGGHIKFWSIKTLNNLLEINNFKVIKNNGVGRLPYLWKGLITLAKKN
ncbi:MAG: hypothetical protein CBC25_05780 [Pelagibacteraceae bacterium TMED65]|nr:MAG: hypothetical protein CBC25_05780 [Pelagibacteraceae bacterium TMED65]|tara:strand:- start:482 stop:1096 length:615 start_codon:yes stop_codon:yes gene_type:complete